MESVARKWHGDGMRWFVLMSVLRAQSGSER